MAARCFSCGNINRNDISKLYGYFVCKACESTLGLLRDATIRKHIASYEKKRESVPENSNYREEIDYRLKFMEEDYTKKRIKLLHIRDRLKKLS